MMALQHAETVLRDYLNTREQKLTEQRKLILDVFLEVKSHLTIEELYNIAKEKNANIGMATVYRTVKILCDSGLASGFRDMEGDLRYEFGHDYHEHLICIKCGQVREVAGPNFAKLQKRVAADSSFNVLHSRLELYGICRECS